MLSHTGTTREESVEHVVDELERTLRELKLWQEQRPPGALRESTMPFSIDTMKLHEWLQWCLIPRIRTLLREGEALPESSAILPYAEEYFGKSGQDVTQLLFVIENFDELISGTTTPTPH